ncbi:hypothetical protein GCM10025789_30590 [Tessaracoccus lubricantis]|uniref:Uncharacterized protein n=1 Tax=Tessaracoccus lubricantis TaxID=545543 RepID=A0ABP9FMC5_9ACTN
MSEYKDGESPLTGMIKSGAGALGIATGAAMGGFVAGPLGAIGGATAGALLQDAMKAVAGDVAARFTSQTEQKRMGAMYVLALESVAARLNGGERPRSESFFRPQARRQAKQLRSEAEELLEGAFLAARKAYEERKVALLANFYTNVVFTDDLDTGHANYILSLMDSLTYRQLLSIFIIGSGQMKNLIRTRDFRNDETLEPLQIGVLFEIYQLIKLDLVTDAQGHYILGVANINPSQLRLQGTGAQLFNLMRPLTLDFDDYGYFINAFKPDFLSPLP